MNVKRNTSATLKLTVTVVVLIVASSVYAQSLTRLQVLATSDRQKADSAAQQLDSLGAGPAQVREVDNLFKVVTRCYASLAEANFAKSALKGAGFMDAFAVAEEQPTATADPRKNSAGELEKFPSVTTQLAFEQSKFDFTIATPPKRSQLITPELEGLDNQKATEQQLLAKAMGFHKKQHAESAIVAFEAFLQRFPDSSSAAQAGLMKGYWLVDKGDVSEAYAQFQQVAERYAGKTEAGEAVLRMAYLLVRMQRDGEALQRFYSVAAGKITATEPVRVEAILRTAALYHRGHDLDAAMQAYGVIVEGASSSEARAFAEMQQAGLLLEKAWSSKATFAGARAKCDEVLTRYRNANKAIRATAALMAFETLAYEGKYEEVLKREQAFLDEFANTEEATLAFYWLAKARYETGDAKGAAAILDSLVTAELPSEKRFKHVEVNSQARRLAARAYEKLGDKAKAKAMLGGK